MNQNWKKIEEAVLTASEMPKEKRDIWLAEFCGGDDRLREEILSLLAFENEAENFLEKSADSYAARIFSETESDISGKQFGRYRILREIGRGGMGAVFLAERADGEFEQQVALKIVRQTILDSESEKRFRRERQILASLHHPNIAPLVDGGVSANGEPFLAMEYIAGETLLDFADKQNLGIAERLKLFLKICSAVSYAHRNLVVHRDIKPSNIIVTLEGEPKLLDFGLAKILDESLSDKEQTATIFRALTPAYASPEQLRGANVTTASDIYSLGIVLYELIKKKRFEAREPNYLIHKPKTELDAVLLTALDEEPERRYKSVEQFAEDIERYLKGQTVKARPNTFFYRTTKFVRRNKLAVSAAALILLTLIGGIAATLWQARAAARERDNARAEATKATRINAFLQEMLRSASPEEKGKDAKVLEVIDDAARRIDTEFNDQPEIKIEILGTLAQTYTDLNIFDKAEQKARQALELSRNVFGENHRAAAESKGLLGMALLAVNRIPEAEPLLRESLEVRRRLSLTDTKEFAATSFALGELLVRKGDFKNAEPLLRETLNTQTRLFGETNADAGMTMLSLGRAAEFSGNAAEGEKLYRRAADIFRQSPRFNERLATALYNLGSNLTTAKRYDEAEQILLEGEQAARASVGESAFVYGMILEQRSRVRLWKKDYVQTEILGRRATEILQKDLLPDNYNLISVRARVGVALIKQGKLAEAEAHLRDILATLRNSPIPEAWRAAYIETRIGESLMLQNRLAEAEPLIVNGYQTMKNTLGEKQELTVIGAEIFAELEKRKAAR